MLVCKPCPKHTRHNQLVVFNYTDVRKPLTRALIDMSTSVAWVNVQIILPINHLLIVISDDVMPMRPVETFD